MTELLSPCVECGELSYEAHCNEHRPQRAPKREQMKKGYDAAWVRLSKKARRLQPFCTDCGTEDDLTADHSPEAWKAYYSGRRITLEMIDVCCRSCNAARGAARGQRITWGGGVAPDGSQPRR